MHFLAVTISQVGSCDILLGKQGVTKSPLAWYRSAVEADRNGNPVIDAALTKAFAFFSRWYPRVPGIRFRLIL
jgi:hypothetical protein